MHNIIWGGLTAVFAKFVFSCEREREGKRRSRGVVKMNDEMGEIKKGPWKLEEDQVLINHVNRYGPRDWSSIRSKGLLRRTGKSCRLRLRWVNKLHPDLKTGMKVSADEERTMIDLQAQFGNKWAKLDTYLPGTTDNDVKNFWSSRQKRLARILHTSTPSSTKQEYQTPNVFHLVPSIEAPMSTSSAEEEIAVKAHLSLLTNTDHKETIKMVPFRDLVNPSSLVCDQSAPPPDYTTPEKYEQQQQQQHTNLSFPQFPQLQPDFSLLLESQDLIAKLGGSNFLDEFEQSSGQLPIMPSFLGPDGSCQISEQQSHYTMEIDNLIDDFPPIDIFDQIETLPSPSEWS